MAGPVSWNFSLDDTSPILSYSPYSDGADLESGWQTWYTSSGFNNEAGEVPSGNSYHLTSRTGASVTLSFYGTGVYLYGSTNGSYEVSFDNEQNVSPTPDQGLLFAKTDAPLGLHNVTLLANISAPLQQLAFDKAVVQSLANSTFSSPNIYSIDNQNYAEINYTGSWSNDSEGQHSTSSRLTQSPNATASLSFTGRAVAVYGSLDWDHGSYSIKLDGDEQILNGSSLWLISNALLFYRDGLNEASEHILNITDLGEKNSTLTLNSVAVYQFSETSAIMPPSRKHSIIGEAVGPVIAFVTALIVGGLFFWTRGRRKRMVDNTGYRSPSTWPGSPTWLRSSMSIASLMPSRHRRRHTEDGSSVFPIFPGFGARAAVNSPAHTQFPGRSLASASETSEKTRKGRRRKDTSSGLRLPFVKRKRERPYISPPSELMSFQELDASYPPPPPPILSRPPVSARRSRLTSNFAPDMLGSQSLRVPERENIAEKSSICTTETHVPSSAGSGIRGSVTEMVVRRLDDTESLTPSRSVLEHDANFENLPPFPEDV